MTTPTAPFTRRILSIYRASSPDQRNEGMTWYDDARSFAASLDSDVNRAAGVIAVVSPMVSWPRNKTIARAIYAGEREGLCLSKNVSKAVSILEGADPETVVTGPKVTAFYRNIIGDSSMVTLDRHAIDIAVGRPLSDDERAFYLSASHRKAIVTAYGNAARIEDISPSAMQAVTWVAWRQTRAVTYHVNG